MSNFAILRGLVAFVDNSDGKGADGLARALLGHPEIGERLSFVSFEMLRDVLNDKGPGIRAAAMTTADALTAGLMEQLTGKAKGRTP
ncbi:hypothetical protein [Variovorax sp. dw_308]|uniref:hypothetical protein n=1 Tax=Variovorax sp. dw_308 TaxID=2721546 RepID=UPI001C48C77B|nr:hypothetical protein [Variovorax sp. dw_308]